MEPHVQAVGPGATAAVPEQQPEEEKPLLVESIAKPTDIRSVALTGLFLMALIYTLHFARPVALPVTLALLANFLLRPIVQKMEKLRIPPPVSAAFVMFLLAAFLGILAYGLYFPARTWAARAPAAISEVGEKLRVLRKPVEKVTKMADQVGKMTQGAPAAGLPAAQQIEVKQPLPVGNLLNTTQEFFGVIIVFVILLFFLLASGDFFLRKLIKVMPTLSDKKRALRIATEMQHDISRYFVTVTLINIGLGVSLALGLWAVGLPNPFLWGALGGLMNFIPYLGATVNITLTTFVALLTFDSFGHALMVPAVYVAINSIEGSIVTPLVLGRRFTLNPVFIFIWLIFWGWLWGVIGALIAVPMLTALKIFCDHIESLSTLGEFLGGENKE